MNPLASVLDIIKYALKATYAYLDLKKETFYFEAEKQYLKEKEELRNEINIARSKGTITDTDMADAKFLRMQEIDRSWQRVSAAYSRNKSGD
jgi:hypothetical protein